MGFEHIILIFQFMRQKYVIVLPWCNITSPRQLKKRVIIFQPQGFKSLIHVYYSYLRVFEKKLKKNTPPESYLLERNPAPEDTYYLYRWGGIGTHLSGYTGDDETKLERAQFAITHSEYYRTGRIVLEPEYRMDYEKACRQFLDTFEEG